MQDRPEKQPDPKQPDPKRPTMEELYGMQGNEGMYGQGQYDSEGKPDPHGKQAQQMKPDPSIEQPQPEKPEQNKK